MSERRPTVTHRAGGAFALLLGLAAPLVAQLVATDNHPIRQVDVDESYESGDHFGAAIVAGDFDHDRIDDLAIGAPEEDLAAGADAGKVSVVFGSRTGLAGAEFQAIEQSALNASSGAAGNRFGAALAAGDFDGDGFADLAIGVPGEMIAAAAGAGGLVVLYGSASGLDLAGDQHWALGAGGLPGAAAADDQLGSALAAGDFDHDGFTDLAVGAPGREVDAIGGAGAVLVIYGSASGLGAARSALKALPAPVAADRFGSALAAGDVNGDGVVDLAVGAADYADAGTAAGVGAVFVLAGETGVGLGSALPALVGTAATGHLGTAVALGDFDGDGSADLAAGAPRSSRLAAEAGDLFAGPVGGAFARLAQGESGLVESAEAGDHFGLALAAADFDLDGKADLAVGAPDETLDDLGPEPFVDAGLSLVLRGTAGGLTTADAELWSLELPSLPFPPLDGDRFAAALAVGDLNGNGFVDLAIGAPGAQFDSLAEVGFVEVLWNRGLFADGFEYPDLDRWSKVLP